MSCPPFLELPAGAKAYRLETARGAFAVHDAPPAGEARGTALLVPGFTGSKEDFIALLGPLSEAGFRTVAVDQRGQYETGGPRDESAYAIEELARDVVALTEALGDGAVNGGTGAGEDGLPVHVLGHSFGGLVVRAAAVDHGPVSWASLTVLSSGPAALHESGSSRLRLLLEAIPAMGLEAVWEAMRQLDREQGTALATAPEVLGFLRERWLANVPEQLIAAGRHLLTERDRVAELAAVPIPKLVLSGSTDDAWPVHWMDDMAMRLNARRAVIDGAGHSPNAELPLETAQELIAFWTSAGEDPEPGDLPGGQRGAHRVDGRGDAAPAGIG